MHIWPICINIHDHLLHYPRTKAALQYNKQLSVKMMVQKQQFCQNHVDNHYCAAIFQYLREYAVLFWDSSLFLCLDDKHRVKLGEPIVPVVAAERGKKVIISTSHSFQVCDLESRRIGASEYVKIAILFKCS